MRGMTEEPSGEIDVSKLYPGMVIANYKELCRLTGMRIEGGDSKKAQLKNLTRYCDYLKAEDNKSFIIIDIYNKPLPMEASGNSKYLQFIQDLLLFYLAERNEKKVYINRNELITYLGLANNKYLEYKDKRDELDMEEWQVNDFYERCDAKMYSILDSSFKCLKKRLLLDYSDAYKIFIRYKGKLYCRVATDSEHSYILKVKRQVMVDMGYSFEYQVYINSAARKEFFERVNSLLYEEMGWDGIYQCYQIIYDPSSVLKAIEIEALRYGLNGVVLEAIDKQADTRREKYNLPSEYSEVQKKLSEMLIKIRRQVKN